jgi:hypothetical protein
MAYPGPTTSETPESDVTPYTVNSPAPAAPVRPPDEDDEPAEGRMTFLEHLDELRKRITHAVVALFVGFLIAFAFIERIWLFVFARLTADVPGGKLIFTEPGEAFFLYLKMAAIAGVLISSPYVMYQVWLFIAPGLYANEKKLAVPFVLFATALSSFPPHGSSSPGSRMTSWRSRRGWSRYGAFTSSCCSPWAWCSSCRC